MVFVCFGWWLRSLGFVFEFGECKVLTGWIMGWDGMGWGLGVLVVKKIGTSDRKDGHLFLCIHAINYMYRQ